MRRQGLRAPRRPHAQSSSRVRCGSTLGGGGASSAQGISSSSRLRGVLPPAAVGLPPPPCRPLPLPPTRGGGGERTARATTTTTLSLPPTSAPTTTCSSASKSQPPPTAANAATNAAAATRGASFAVSRPSCRSPMSPRRRTLLRHYLAPRCARDARCRDGDARRGDAPPTVPPRAPPRRRAARAAPFVLPTPRCAASAPLSRRRRARPAPPRPQRRGGRLGGNPMATAVAVCKMAAVPLRTMRPPQLSARAPRAAAVGAGNAVFDGHRECRRRAVAQRLLEWAETCSRPPCPPPPPRGCRRTSAPPPPPPVVIIVGSARSLGGPARPGSFPHARRRPPPTLPTRAAALHAALAASGARKASRRRRVVATRHPGPAHWRIAHARAIASMGEERDTRPSADGGAAGAHDDESYGVRCCARRPPPSKLDAVAFAARRSPTCGGGRRGQERPEGHP